MASCGGDGSWNVSLCLSLVLVNGSLSCLFKAHRRLRHGDLLLPFLFTIAVEALVALFLRVKSLGFIDGFKVCRNGVSISHLQFAEDIVLLALAR